MLSYRITHTKYMYDTSGEGARLLGGRWNAPGVACIYTSLHVSLAILEKLAHAQWPHDMKDLAMGTYEVFAPEEIYTIEEARLKPFWQQDIAYTQWMGRQILEAGYAGFKAPSAIVPSEYNLVLNPHCLGKHTAVLQGAWLFTIDSRLYSKPPG